MSALAPISSASPPGADLPSGVAEGPFLTPSRHSSTTHLESCSVHLVPVSYRQAAAGPFAAMTSLDPEASRSLDSRAMARECRSAPSRHETISAPAVQSLNQPTTPRDRYAMCRSRPESPSTVIPSLGNKNPFHRQDFVRWLGALRNSMPPHRIRRATTPADKSWRPSVGRIGPPAALRGLPDAGASRRAARRTGRTNAPP